MNRTPSPPAAGIHAGFDGAHTELLVIGAGPYGLATAAAAGSVGIEPLVVGEPMEFWRRNMPARMLLRSSLDWHLDPLGRHTLTAYLDAAGVARAGVDPIPLELFVDYADWFRAENAIRVHPLRVEHLRGAAGGLEATFGDGRRVRADAVVAAPGVAPFARLPAWVERQVSPGRYSHTSVLSDPTRFGGARCLIVGGGQSAFETAALLAEAGAEQVDIVHRHATPRFTSADWRFVEPLIEATLRWPGWFKRLSVGERATIRHRFWAQGRLKLEPWLAPRLARPEIRRWPNETVTSVAERWDGLLGARLSGGALVNVDHIILATGYAADLTRVPYLSGVLDELRMVDGLAVLDERFRSTVPGLYITGFPATRDFGPFFGLLRGASAAASMIATALTGAPAGGVPRLAPARPARRRPRGSTRALADAGPAARRAARRSVG